jgi:hypothetical protein
VIEQLEPGRASWLKGYRVKIIDGNCLAATEHRLEPLRGLRAGAFPGKSLVMYEPVLGLVTDVFPCEDGHAQECALLGEVLPTIRVGELWLHDRNFCTWEFLGGHVRQGAFFLSRRIGILNALFDEEGQYGWARERQRTYAVACVADKPILAATGFHPSLYPTHRRAFWKRRNQGPSSCGQSRGSQEYCRRRKQRSGWGISIVTRPSALVRPVIPSGEPLGF